ncbi:hypothetical protein GX441_06760 [bacterium]|nr:hypothetical protein [bacterium]
MRKHRHIAYVAIAVAFALLQCTPPTEIATIQVSPTPVSVAIGGTQQLTAKAFDANSAEVSNVTFTWTSSNTAVATVNSTGLVTGVSAGTANITAEAEGKQGIATVTVRSGAAIYRIEITPSTATVSVNGTKQFTAKALDASDNEITGIPFAWSSSDTLVAKVNASGLATGLGQGSASIIAAAEGKADTATLVVGGGPTYHNQTISSNEVWEPVGNPHIIQADISVQDNATLTIKPGCIVKFEAGNELYCGYNGAGAIIAEGTADSTITFTSNVPSPTPGDWKSIGIYDKSMSTTSFKYCIIEYGGMNAQDGEVVVNDFGVKFSNCTVRKSASYGVKLNDNGYFKTFENNTFTECANFPLNIFVEQVRTIGTGNTFTGNTKNSILVRGGTLASTCTWANLGVPYEIDNDVSIGDDTNTPTLTIGPGTTIKLQSGVEFYVGYYGPGGLIADGTAGWITFTSSVSSQSKGDWKKISFYEHSIDAQCKLKNCKIEYAGYDEDGNVYIQDAMPEITGDSIGHGKGYGIYVAGSEYPDTTTLRISNAFYDNTLGEVGP